MATRFDVLPGGRLKQFRNRQGRCSCNKKTPGRPGLVRGVCHGYGRRASRVVRRRGAQALLTLRSRGFDPADVEAFDAPETGREAGA